MRTAAAASRRTQGRQIRRRRFRTLIVLMILIAEAGIAAAAGTAVSAQAAAIERQESIDYSSRLIREGETLWSIASETRPVGTDIRCYIDEIREANALQGDSIHAGRYLIIPIHTVS